MARTVSIAKVFRPGGGRLHVMKTNKQGFIMTTADAQAIADAVVAAITDEALIVAAIKKVGAANAETLEGKTVTLTFDVDIA